MIDVWKRLPNFPLVYGIFKDDCFNRTFMLRNSVIRLEFKDKETLEALKPFLHENQLIEKPPTK